MLKQKYECQLSSNTWNREFTFFKYVNNVFVFPSVLTNLQVHVIKSKSFDVNELFINTLITCKKKSLFSRRVFIIVYISQNSEDVT